MDFEAADRALDYAQKLFSQARDLKRQASEMEQEARKIQNEALEVVLPFKTGDIIEFTTLQGWRPQKRVTRRMFVKWLIQRHDVVVASGVRYNAKMERTSQSISMTLPSETDKFVKVLKSREE